jgi:hypothetical protein
VEEVTMEVSGSETIEEIAEPVAQVETPTDEAPIEEETDEDEVSEVPKVELEWIEESPEVASAPNDTKDEIDELINEMNDIKAKSKKASSDGSFFDNI